MLYIGQLEFCVWEYCITPCLHFPNVVCSVLLLCDLKLQVVKEEEMATARKEQKFQCNHSNPLLVPSLTQNQVGMGTGARLPGQPSERSCSLDLVFNLIQSGLSYVGFGMVKKSQVLYDFFTRICFTAQRQSEKEFLSLLLANESSKGCV